MPFFDIHQLITHLKFELLTALTNAGMFKMTDIEVEIIFEIIAYFFLTVPQT